MKVLDEDDPTKCGSVDELETRIVDLTCEVRNHKVIAGERGKVLQAFADELIRRRLDEARGQGRLKLGAG